MFLCGNHWRFWTFSILWIWNKFSERRLLKSRSIVFQLKVLWNISIQNTLSKANDKTNTAWKLSKYRVIFGLYYPVFRLNVEIFSCIWTEYRDLQSKSPYLVWIQENVDQKKFLIWTLFTQWNRMGNRKWRYQILLILGFCVIYKV